MSPYHEPTRRRMERKRSGVTHSVAIAGADVFVTGNTYEDGRLGEVFAKWGKGGSTASGLMDAFSIILSLALQYGVPLAVIVEKLKDMRFEPFGMTDDTDISEVSSVMDYIARRLAIDFLPADTRRDLGVQTMDDQVADLTS